MRAVVFILLLGPLLYIEGAGSVVAEPHDDVSAVEGKKQAADEPAVTADSVSRGQMLYENHCRVCHDSTVHIRENHKSKSPEDIRGWAVRWSNHLKLQWSAEEINAVVEHLSEKYYHFKAIP